MPLLKIIFTIFPKGNGSLMKRHFFNLKRIAAMCFAPVLICSTLSGCFSVDTAGLGEYNEDEVVFKQFEPMEDGEEIAVIKTDVGEFKIRFFEDEAPNAVQNFKTLAKEGFYDNKSVYNIQKAEDESEGKVYNIAFMTGASDEKGAEGKSAVNDDQPYPKELSYNLYPFPGAIAAYSDDKTCDSRFFVVGESPISESVIKGMEVAQFPELIQNKFKEVGGVPSLTHSYTIFAQIFEGYDVAQQIMQVETDDTGKPVNDIFINSVTIETYSESQE